MSVRNAIALSLALSTLALLAGCGSGSSSPPAQAPPSGSFSNSNLTGTYVFSISGLDQVDGIPVQIVGTVIANGSGGITGGTIDVVDVASPTSFVATNLSVSGNGTYSVGVDGRGTATITTTTPNPFARALTFDFVLQNSSHGLITEFDTNASGSGTLDLQGTATLSGTYAFSLSGTDGSENLNPMATVGAFTVGNGGSITGVEDFNDNNFAYPNQALSGSIILGPSSTPSTTFATESFPLLTFDVYAIDSTHLKFIETDGVEFLSGDAYSQTTATVATGSLAFTLAGDFESQGPTAVGGFMVTDGAGNITNASTEDINEAGNTSSSPVPFTASYSSSGSGRFTLTNFSGFVGAVTDGAGYAAYPSSGGLLLLEIDDAGIMVGAAYTPGIVASFAPPQGFALNFTGVNLSASESLGQAVEVDDIAEFATATGLTFTGQVDENSAPDGGPTRRQVFDGIFTAPDSNGRGTLGTTTINGTLVGEVGLSFYSVDGTTFPFIEDDTNGQVSTGVMVVQDATDPTPAVAARTHMYVPHPFVRARSTRSLHRKQK
jgi:hypothetical protein